MASSGELLEEYGGLQALPAEAWNAYRRWNQALCQHFLSGQFQGRPIYLDLDDRALEAIQSSAFPDVTHIEAHLITSVRATLNTSTQVANPFGMHVANCSSWQKSQYRGFPPFVALLGLFAFVAEQMVADADFAPNNYYGRLRDLLYLPKHAEENLISGYRATASALWPALNSWLTEWNGALGLPTARPLDHRKYVSVAISQALVREHDRALLRRMFWDLQFDPGQRVSKEEMRSALAHWIGQGRQTSSLGRLFARGGDITEHIIDLSCSELEAWDGQGGRPEGGTTTGRLAVVGALQKHPLPKLDLYIAAQIPAESISDIDVRMGSGCDEIARSAMADARGHMRLERIEDTEIVSLEPWSEMRSGDVLLARLDLEAPSRPERKFVRVGGPLCVLSYRENEGIFKEIPQAPLMERLLVLAHESIVTKVNDHLNQVARPGFRNLTSSGLQGLPTRWTAFVDIQIVRSMDALGLECLSPLNSTALLASGGMNMGYETWHRAVPPELSIADSNSASPLRVLMKQELALRTRTKEIIVDGIQGGAVINLGQYELPDGDYSVSVHGGQSMAVAQLRFRLRSSDCARPSAVVAGHELVHAVLQTNPLGLLSARLKREVDADPAFATATCVKGANLRQPTAIDVRTSNRKLPSEIGSTGSDVEVPIGRGGIAETLTTESGSCVQRGYHVWSLPFITPGSGHPKKLLGKCSGCNTELWIVRASKKVSGAKNEASSHAVHQAPPPRIAPVSSHGTGVEFEVVFDGLNYLRGGSFATLSSLVSTADDSPWAAFEYSRALAACCHIDVMLDEKTMRPCAWMIAPAGIVEIAERRAVLVGWRSPRLLAILAKIIDSLNGQMTAQWSSDGIPVVSVNGLSSQGLSALCDRLSKEGEAVQYIRDLAPRLVNALPSLSAVKDGLEHVRPPNSDLEVFDFQTLRWIRASSYETPGAYRSRWRGTTYFYVPREPAGHREGRIVDPRTAKHLAAADCNHALVAYRREECSLVVPLGCELPGLLERVAVMCDGAPPERRGGHVYYKNVPESVALAIWNRLA